MNKTSLWVVLAALCAPLAHADPNACDSYVTQIKPFENGFMYYTGLGGARFIYEKQGTRRYQRIQKKLQDSYENKAGLVVREENGEVVDLALDPSCVRTLLRGDRKKALYAKLEKLLSDKRLFSDKILVWDKRRILAE